MPYPTIPLTEINRKPGRRAGTDWEEMAQAVQDAYQKGLGIVVPVPECQPHEQDIVRENYRKSIAIMLTKLTGHKIGVSIQNRNHFNVWLKDELAGG